MEKPAFMDTFSKTVSAETGLKQAREEGLSAAARRLLGQNLLLTSMVLTILVVVGLTFAIAEDPSHYAAAILWSLASLAIGAIGGFLFAIPRVPRPTAQAKGTESTASAEATASASVGGDRGLGLGINTNLE